MSEDLPGAHAAAAPGAGPGAALHESADDQRIVLSNQPLAADHRPPQRPQVSFIVLSYNNATFLRETLDSVAAQSFADMEVVIGDDGSSDASTDVIRAWMQQQQGRRVIAVLWRSNGGIARNYNGALEWATGRYIAHIGSDDVNEPQRVEVQVRALESSPAAMAISGMVVIDSQGRFVRRAWPDPARQQRAAIVAAGQVAVTSPTMTYRRALIDDFGLLPADLTNEDEALAFRAVMRGGIETTAQALVRYRVHGNSVSARNRQLTLGGYVTWLERNLPAQMANKRHWLAVMARAAAPQEEQARARAHLDALRRQLEFVSREACGGSGPRLRQLVVDARGRSILKSFVLQALRALRLELMLRLARRRPPLGTAGS